MECGLCGAVDGDFRVFWDDDDGKGHVFCDEDCADADRNLAAESNAKPVWPVTVAPEEGSTTFFVGTTSQRVCDELWKRGGQLTHSLPVTNSETGNSNYWTRFEMPRKEVEPK